MGYELSGYHNRISDRQRICNSCDNPMDPDNKTSVRAYWNFALEVEDGDKASLQIFSCDDQVRLILLNETSTQLSAVSHSERP